MYLMIFLSDLSFISERTHNSYVMSLSIYIANKEGFKTLLLILFTLYWILSFYDLYYYFS